MRREWTPEDLIASWTLVEDDWRLVGNKTGATRLGFALLLKFFELEARFPRHAGEVPKAPIDYVAQQVKVEPALFSQYAWSGRTIEYHRAQSGPRSAFGSRRWRTRTGWPSGWQKTSATASSVRSGSARRYSTSVAAASGGPPGSPAGGIPRSRWRGSSPGSSATPRSTRGDPPWRSCPRWR